MTPPAPTVLVDTREQQPLEFMRLPSRRATLATGDYSVEGYEAVFCVERKSVPDLVHSVTGARDRFLREIQRMDGFLFRRIVVVGSEADVERGAFIDRANRMTPEARARCIRGILSSLDTIEVRHGVPIRFFTSPQRAAAQIERWAYHFARTHNQEHTS